MSSVTKSILSVNVVSQVEDVPPGIGQYVDADKVFSWSGEVNMGNSSLDNPLLTLTNPIGSGKKILLQKIYGGVAISNNWTLLKVLFNPTISTPGTLVTPKNNNLGSGVSGSAEVRTLPVITQPNLGIKLRSLFNGENNNSIVFVEEGTLLLNEGGTILITGKPKSNSRDLSLTVIWFEI